MRPVNEKLRKDLLEAGKREFMENGFRGASLKSIAASLGVTTGAIYRYYTDKEALFDGLVREPAQELVERYRTLQQTFAGRSLEEQLQKLPEVPDKEASWMMDFLYDHFDAFKLIACCSSGTKYEHYLDTLAEIEDHSGRLLVDRMAKLFIEKAEKCADFFVFSFPRPIFFKQPEKDTAAKDQHCGGDQYRTGYYLHWYGQLLP